MNQKKFQKQIKELRSKTVFNISNSAEIGAKYIQDLNDSLQS